MTSNDNWSVLLVGDGLDIEQAAIRYEGWAVEQVAHADLQKLLAGKPRPRIELIVVNHSEGAEEPSQLRATLHDAGCPAPVLYLTDEQTMPGVTAIGDNFLTRPYSLEQVTAALRALARHAPEFPGARPKRTYEMGDLVVDEEARSVTRAGEVIRLSPQEFDLVRYLIRFPQRVQSRRHLIDHVWPLGKAVSSGSIDLAISYLRRKLDAGRQPMLITVRGSGFILRPTA